MRVVVAQLSRDILDWQLAFRQPFFSHFEPVHRKIFAKGVVRFLAENAAQIVRVIVKAGLHMKVACNLLLEMFG